MVWGSARPVWPSCCSRNPDLVLHPSRPGHHHITSTLFLALHFTCLSFRALPALTLSVHVSDPPISAQYQPGINQSQARRTECLQNYQRSSQHLFCITDGETLEKCPVLYSIQWPKARIWLEVYSPPKVPLSPCVWRPTIPDVLADSVSVRAAVRGCGVRMRGAGVESGMIAPCSVAVSMPAEKHLPGHPAPGHPPQPPTEQAIHYK